MPASRWTSALFLAGLGAAAAAVHACLPDLEPPSARARDAAARPPACGDGFVDSRLGEQCDPGAAGDAGASGCTSACVVECPAGGFVDSTSRHCYFPIDERTFAAAKAACEAVRAHVVTFAGEDEHAAVLGALKPAAPLWVGLKGSNRAGFRSEVDDEPGYSPSCPGCFAHLQGLEGGIPEVGGSCVVATGDRAVAWRTADCEELHAVVCEREPLGGRAELCNGALCTEVPRTAGSGKRYAFFAALSRTESAVATCAGLENGRLVVFATPEEREQVFAELKRADVFAARRELWIGLSRAGGADAGPWRWDDGAEARGPSLTPWGMGEPRATGPARAFLARTLEIDTQLARAEDPAPDRPRELPFLCEYYPTVAVP